MYHVDRTIKFNFKTYRNAHLHARHNTDKHAHSEFAKNTVHICMPGITQINMHIVSLLKTLYTSACQA